MNLRFVCHTYFNSKLRINLCLSNIYFLWQIYCYFSGDACNLDQNWRIGGIYILPLYIYRWRRTVQLRATRRHIYQNGGSVYVLRLTVKEILHCFFQSLLRCVTLFYIFGQKTLFYIVDFIIFWRWTEPLDISSWNVGTPIFLQYCLPALTIHCLVLHQDSLFVVRMNVFIHFFFEMSRKNLFILYLGFLAVIW